MPFAIFFAGIVDIPLKLLNEIFLIEFHLIDFITFLYLLLSRWADYTKSVNKNGDLVEFNHPFVQACSMFLGEMLCLITFKALFITYRRRGVGYGPIIHFDMINATE